MLIQDKGSKLVQGAWTRFNSNLGSLYAFFEALTKTADEVDKRKLHELANELSFVFKDKPEIIEKDFARYIPSVDDLDVFPDFRKDDTIQAVVSAFRDEDVLNAIREWEEKHPHRSQRLVRAFSSAFNSPPMNGVMIRRSMLVSLVTFLEIYLEDLHKNNHLVQGMSLADAKKGAQKAMRKDWRSKLTGVEKIDLSLPAIPKFVDEIYEFTQRRNLLVHNDGVVDESYKKNVQCDYDLGDHLLVSTQYFQRAIDLVHLFGFLLFYKQLSHCVTNKQNLYNKLDEFILTSLDQKRYSLILELSENMDSLDLPGYKQQIVLVNKAIAYRELGKADEVTMIASHLESVGHDWQIDMAISMLRNDVDALKKQIEQAPNTPGIMRVASWPLFDPVKNEVWFKVAFMKKSKMRTAQIGGKKKRKN